MNNYSTYVFWVTRVNNPTHDSSFCVSYSASWDAVRASPVCLSPPTGKLPFLATPSHSGRGISVDLAQEVYSLFLHDHLVHWPPHQHGTLCRERESLKRIQFMLLIGLTFYRNIRDSPYTTSSAGSLSLSPTIFVPTHTYMPASFFLVWEIISLPPRIWKTAI